MLKISVIIPCYNSEKFLAQCLNSVLEQTLKNIEVICIDDGSTDNTFDILKKYQIKDNRIKLLTQENKGAGPARNLALKKAEGEFIAFMDADDFYPSNETLELLYNAAKENNVLASCGEFSEFDGKEITQNYSGSLAKYLFEKDGIIKYKDFQFDYGYIRFIYNREFLIKNNLFFPDYRRFEDPPFFIRTMSLMNEFYAIKKSTYVYRVCHKTINWTQESIDGVFRGLGDCLRIARKNKYKKLLKLSTKRLLKEYYPMVKKHMNIGTYFSYIKSLLLADRIELAKCILKNIFSVSNDNSHTHKIVSFFCVKIKIKIKEDKENSMTNTIGIVGCGFIGGALKMWLEEHNPYVKILVSDPPKGYNDDLSEADAIFISIHIPTEIDGTQDLTLLKSIISNLPNKPIFIRTTILPGTCDRLSKEFNKKIYFMPEFLTQRTAYEDFSRQPMVFCGEEELLANIFKGKKYLVMSNIEAEITKYAHNVFGALKVTYFNGINELCKKHGADYSKIQQGCLLSGYINEPHTMVPGPDGGYGYGGKCFPKDVNAFIDFVEGTQLQKIIKLLPEINELYRSEAKQKETINV